MKYAKKFVNISKTIRAKNLKHEQNKPQIIEVDPITFGNCLEERSEQNLLPNQREKCDLHQFYE